VGHARLFAHTGYTDLYWVSSPNATHSRNIAARPQIGIVIFDSSVPIGTGQGVYITATASAAADADLASGVEVFSERGVQHGGQPFTVSDVQDPSEMRLYRAVAHGFSMLAKDGQPDHRIPVDPR
jgi:hypothetical protein